MKIFRKALATSMFLLGGVFIGAGVSFAVDANFNTQSSDIRSDSANPANPGFNPCVTGSRSAAGVCSATTGSLLAADNLGNNAAPGLFTILGPGAVTDNMFGLVERPADPGICGAQSNPGTNSLGTATPKLNCGDVRFDPGTQGQTIPVGNNTLTSPITATFLLSADFCAAPLGPDCAGGTTDAHVGFSVSDTFSWNPLPGGTQAHTKSAQVMSQVTALKPSAGIGTFAAPGDGDQRVIVKSDFDTTVSGVASSNSATASPGSLIVNWEQTIEDPDQSGLGTGKFTQTISGSFEKNLGGFPAVQYPNGQSQTNGISTGAAVNLP